jgi:hypothetical protein
MLRTLLLLLPCLLLAQGDPPFISEPGWKPLLTGRDLKGWHPKDPSKPHTWLAAKAIRFDPAAPKKLSAVSGPGDRILNGPDGKTQDWISDEKFGDMELYVEWMVPQGSNSGVYLQGLYEVQVFDSWGKAQVNYSDAGGIYHRWINEKGVGGSSPKVNASRPPGEWQWYRIWFRAPHFDAHGRKTANARFLKVIHNGILVQDDVEVDGGTRAHLPIPEAAKNPLMLQGDHGPVAYRNLYWRPLP